MEPSTRYGQGPSIFRGPKYFLATYGRIQDPLDLDYLDHKRIQLHLLHKMVRAGKYNVSGMVHRFRTSLKNILALI